MKTFTGRRSAPCACAVRRWTWCASRMPGFRESPDPDLLAWAAENGRVILTHDAETLAGFAHARVQAGEPMCGVIEVRLGGAMRRIVDDVLLVVELAREDEIAGKIVFVPFSA